MKIRAFLWFILQAKLHLKLLLSVNYHSIKKNKSSFFIFLQRKYLLYLRFNFKTNLL